MKSFKFIASFCLLLFISVVALAQVTVNGVVKDNAGEPLIGVTILEKGTTNGTVTDVDGKYALSASSGNAVLIFSYIGYTEQEISLAGRSVVDIIMLEDVEQLSEVVISALGFKENRDRISSTYSQVDGDKVVQKGENKVIDGLGGKMSGVKISATSGDPGAGANILIRGQSTISGETQPLIIVDGIPLNNDQIRGLSSEAASDAGVNQQARLNDINPEDIESFQVYKGASAGALYGSRGINGVIVITTKRGKAGKPNITFSSSMTVDQISRKHDLQSTYGQGNGGSWGRDQQRSWGDKISERSGGANDVDETGEYFVSYEDGSRLYPITGMNSRDTYIDSNFDQVFQTGITWDNKLTMSGGNESTTYFFSMSRVEQEGIIKNSTYDKTNITASMNQKINNWLTLDFKANYINSESNRIQTGSNTAGLYLSLLRTAPDFDATDYVGDYVSSSGVVTPYRHRSYRRSRAQTGNPTYNNPRWTVEQQTNVTAVNRFIGSGQLDFKITDNINVIARAGADTYTDNRTYFFPYYSAGSINGELEDEAITVYDYNTDILANFNFNITPDITNTTTLGFNLNSRSRKINYSQAINFTENFRSPLDPFELTSTDNISSEISRRFYRYVRFYGTTNFSLKNMLFLTVGGSYEKHSTLEDGFFYPSVELGWLASETFDLPQWWTFGKLRLAYGQVGNAPIAHRASTIYEVGSFSSFSDGLDLAFFGGGYQLNEILGNRSLRPEVKTEYELGVDLRFFQNRFTVSATGYSNRIKDVLLNIGLPTSIGYTDIYGNGAELTNKGFELEAGYLIFDRNDWSVGLNANISTNRNMVVDTKSSVINLTPGSSVQGVVIEGYPMGSFYTQGILRDENGVKQFNADGYPILDVSGNIVVGDPNPDWRGGLGLNASYKNLRFNMLVETSQGNDFAGRTEFILEFFGTHANTDSEVTLTSDMTNYAGDIVAAGTTVRGNISDLGAGPVLLDEAWYTGAQGFGDGKFNELAVSDGSWTRIREASLSYSINKGLPDAISNIELSVAGRNLFIWSGVEGIDPDVNQFGRGYGIGIDYFTNPGTRSYIFTLRATF